MNRPIPRQTLPAITTVWLLLTLALFSQTSSRLSTCFLARGEQALLEIATEGPTPGEPPVIKPIPNVTIQPLSGVPQTRSIPGRKFQFVHQFVVTSYEVGHYQIPAIEVKVGSQSTFSEPIDFKVFNPDELQWFEGTIDGHTIRYASSFRLMNPTPYEGETTYAEIKVFVPRSLYVEDWGIPDFQREGLTAWRFQPSQMRSQLILLGSPYISVAYPSTITPTRTGTASIGPAKVRLTTVQRVDDPFPKNEYRDLYLEVPKLEIKPKPLPDGAPEGFENAVGNFRLSASTTNTNVKEGDPLSVDLMVSGTGNLDTLRAPKLVNSDGWKMYDATGDQRNDERRQVSGTAIFHQFMRPLELKTQIPPFRLVFFDPKEEVYKTVTTEPINLNMTPNLIPKSVSEGQVQALTVPVERMTDILSIIKPAQLTVPVSSNLPPWLGHLVASLLALGLILKALWLRYGARFKKNPERERRLGALREIEKRKPAADVDFLKSAGSYIETWLGENSSPDLQSILEERDAVCYRSEPPQSLLNRERRASILRTLRKAAMACAFIGVFVFGSSPASAQNIGQQAADAYDSAKYDEAIRLWMSAGNYESLSANTLYDIGNACYRSNAPGYAALYYRRALVRDPEHQESRQNLRFIERKYGSITVHRPDYQYAITRIPLSMWKAILWSGLWLTGLALLVFPATRSGARIRWVAVFILIVAPFIASAGLLGWRYFPNDAEFVTIRKQAVFVVEDAVLHTDAARTSPEVIDAPPGSLCEIIRETGRWTYVGFATKTRGWVPNESIKRVIPLESPEPPKFRKPKADGKSA